MPYVIRPRQLRRTIAAIAGAAMLLAVAPAVASASCASSSTSKPFAELGDSNLYSLLSGSSFEESGAPGWTLRNAEVVGEDEQGESGRPHALEIEAGGTVVSPSFCINTEEPSFRFFVRQESAGGQRGFGMYGPSLAVSILWTDMFHIRHVTPVANLTSGSSWTPSEVLPLATKLPLWMPGATLTAQLQFKAEGSSAWEIDDVYIDPHSR